MPKGVRYKAIIWWRNTGQNMFWISICKLLSRFYQVIWYISRFLLYILLSPGVFVNMSSGWCMVHSWIYQVLVKFLSYWCFIWRVPPRVMSLTYWKWNYMDVRRKGRKQWYKNKRLIQMHQVIFSSLSCLYLVIFSLLSSFLVFFYRKLR